MKSPLNSSAKRTNHPKERHRIITFDYGDIAIARGITRGAVRKAVSRRVLNPNDLMSIAQYVLRLKVGENLQKGASKSLKSA